MTRVFQRIHKFRDVVVQGSECALYVLVTHPTSRTPVLIYTNSFSHTFIQYKPHNGTSSTRRRSGDFSRCIFSGRSAASLLISAIEYFSAGERSSA